MISKKRSADLQEEGEAHEEDGKAPMYFVALEDPGDRNRALPMMIAGRRCYQCQQADPQDWQDPSSAKVYMKRIGAHCAETADYLLPDTPLKEAIFRIILAVGNKPISPEDVSGELTARWAMTAHARDISPTRIQILLDNSPSYCVTRLPEPEKVEEEIESIAEAQLTDEIAETPGVEPEAATSPGADEGESGEAESAETKGETPSETAEPDGEV